MYVKKLEVNNFKSFQKLSIKLRDYNVLIGANASGKSNFVQIFKFLRDIADYGLESAISLQGGLEYLRNSKLASNKELKISITIGRIPGVKLVGDEHKIGSTSTEATYEFSLKFYKTNKNYRVSSDKLIIKNTYEALSPQRTTKKQLLGKGEYVIENKNGKIKFSPIYPLGVEKDKDIEMLRFFISQDISENTLLIESKIFSFFFSPSSGLPFSDSLIFDFDPKISKRFSPITGKNYLEEDGSNLAIAIRHIIKSEENREKFISLITDLLPFIKDLDVKKIADKSLIFSIKEIYNPDFDLPSSILSDGTINITALVIALYFSNRHTKRLFSLDPSKNEKVGEPLIIIEEPEKNIHASLLSRVVSLIEDASNQKQIIITTHNPEVVKHAGIDNLLLLSKEKDGFSRISKPSKKKEISAFMDAEIGLDNLFVQDLL